MKTRLLTQHEFDYCIERLVKGWYLKRKSAKEFLTKTEVEFFDEARLKLRKRLAAMDIRLRK